jgi:hypothetical protein
MRSAPMAELLLLTLWAQALGALLDPTGALPESAHRLREAAVGEGRAATRRGPTAQTGAAAGTTTRGARGSPTAAPTTQATATPASALGASAAPA